MPEEATTQTLGSETYGDSYYQDYWGCDAPYEPGHPHWVAFFNLVADRIVNDFHPRTTLDVGCAMGFLVAALRERGVGAGGFDLSDYAIGRAAEVSPGLEQHVWVASAADPIERHYDLITCIEVIEHIPEMEARKAIANMTGATDRVLFSSTPGDFGEPTHINVQPVEYWAELFAEQGFFRDFEASTSFLTPWATLFVKSDLPAQRLVRRYEADRALLRLERDHLRAEVQRQFQESHRTSQDESGLNADGADSEELIERLQMELLAARDAVVGQSAEVEQLRSELRRLEGEAHVHLSHAQSLSAMVGTDETLNAMKHSRSGRALVRSFQAYRKAKDAIR